MDKAPGVEVSNSITSTSGQVMVGGSGTVFNISSPSAADPPMPTTSTVQLQLQTPPTVSAPVAANPLLPTTSRVHF